MRSSRLALLLGILAAAAIFLALRPVDCFYDGPPSEKTCITASGTQVSWPYNGPVDVDALGTFSADMSRTVGPPIVFYMFLAGALSAGIGYAVGEWRRDRFESFLTPS